MVAAYCILHTIDDLPDGGGKKEKPCMKWTNLGATTMHENG